jgi:hypothetical protein
MPLHRKGKLTIAKSKSSRLSYSEIVSLPLESIFSKISKYDADLSDYVVSFISISLGLIVKNMIVDGLGIIYNSKLTRLVFCYYPGTYVSKINVL